jgi:hypothetical protein
MAMMHYEPSYRAPLHGYGWRLPVLELLVPMCCHKCQEKIRESMLELRGVQGVIADLTTQRVIVHGFVDPMKALKKAKKVKRDSQLWSGGAAPQLEYQSPSKYRRSEYRPGSLYRTSSYERRLPISSVYRTSSLERRVAPVYRASYNQFTPSYGTRSIIHRPARPFFESTYVDDPYMITNPHFMKHIESEYY